MEGRITISATLNRLSLFRLARFDTKLIRLDPNLNAFAIIAVEEGIEASLHPTTEIGVNRMIPTWHLIPAVCIPGVAGIKDDFSPNASIE